MNEETKNRVIEILKRRWQKTKGGKNDHFGLKVINALKSAGVDPSPANVSEIASAISQRRSTVRTKALPTEERPDRKTQPQSKLGTGRRQGEIFAGHRLAFTSH